MRTGLGQGSLGVARPHNRGVHVLVDALRGDEQLGVSQCDPDRVAGACSRSRISAVTRRAAMAISMPYTAARVEAGNK